MRTLFDITLRKDCEGKLALFAGWAETRLQGSDDPFRASPLSLYILP